MEKKEIRPMSGVVQDYITKREAVFEHEKNRDNSGANPKQEQFISNNNDTRPRVAGKDETS